MMRSGFTKRFSLAYVLWFSSLLIVFVSMINTIGYNTHRVSALPNSTVLFCENEKFTISAENYINIYKINKPPQSVKNIKNIFNYTDYFEDSNFLKQKLYLQQNSSYKIDGDCYDVDVHPKNSILNDKGVFTINSSGMYEFKIKKKDKYCEAISITMNRTFYDVSQLTNNCTSVCDARNECVIVEATHSDKIDNVTYVKVNYVDHKVYTTLTLIFIVLIVLPVIIFTLLMIFKSDNRHDGYMELNS